MPHLVAQHSANIAPARMQQLCGELLRALAETGHYPLGGIRVRAVPCTAYAIADGHPANAFVDMVLRIAAGRSVDAKTETGVKLMQVAEVFFAGELAQPHFALSLEIVEIGVAFSWKTNSIHPRLKAKS